jgi:hypothetical protein
MELVLISQVGKINTLYQGCQIYCICVHAVPTLFVYLFFYFLFFYSTSISMFWRICAYIYIYTHTHIPDCFEIVYELLLVPNNTASEIFLHKLGAVRSVDWIFFTEALAWWWQGEHMILEKTFYNILFKQEVIAATVTSTYSSISHSLTEP